MMEEPMLLMPMPLEQARVVTEAYLDIIKGTMEQEEAIIEFGLDTAEEVVKAVEVLEKLFAMGDEDATNVH